MTILPRDLSSFYSLFLRDKYLVYNRWPPSSYLFVKKIIIDVCTHVYIHNVYIYVCMHTFEGHRYFVLSVLSFHLYMGSGFLTQVTRFVRQSFLSTKLSCWAPTKHFLSNEQFNEQFSC